MADLGTAYVQIVPSAQGIEGSITNLFSGEAQSAGTATGETMGESMASGINMKLLAGAAAIGGTIAAIAHEAWETINEVAAYGDTIDKQSQMLSISARAYQELSFAAERSGTSISSFSRGIRTITNDMADAANGVSGATDKFDRLGISLYDANGQMRNTEDVLMSSIMALADMEDVTQRNALANDIFGRSYTELLPLLNSGSDGIEDLFNRFNELNGAMSDEGVQASAEFQDAMTNLDTAVQGVKNQLAENGLLGRFTDWINAAADWVASDHPVLERAFETLDGAVGDLADGISGVAYALDGLGEVTSTLDYLLEPITSKFHEFKEQIIADFNGLAPGLGSAGVNAIEALLGGFTSKAGYLGSLAGAVSAALRGDMSAYNEFAGRVGLPSAQQTMANAINSGQATGFGSQYGSMGSRTTYTVNATPRANINVGH